MIFQSELTNIDTEITALLAQVEAAKQRQTQLIELDTLTDHTLEGLADVVSKIQCSAPDAIASLKSAVLGLFDSGDDGNKPTDPAPDNDPDEPELLCLNGETGDCLTTADLDYELASPFATPLACQLWEDAPLLGQACTVEFPQPDSQKPAYTEFVGVSDRVGYIKLNTTGEIIATYAGFNNKSRAKSWANYLETMTSRIELRAAKRLGDWKHELKISGLSITQIERLTTENLDKMPPDKEPSLPPTYKPQLIPQPVNPDEVGKDDIVTALLTPSASYKIIQVMPNGILDCENLTTGDRLGLRPGAVSLVQKAEKLQEPGQQALDFEPKPNAPTKYARVKLKGDRFDGQVLSVVKGNELGATLATPDGHHWFRSDCLQIIDPDAQTTTGNYKGLSKQMRQHWEKVGINPSDLIADMKANRPPEPEWNAAKYNPVLAAVGAGDDLDF